jgi:hypothetical protein
MSDGKLYVSPEVGSEAYFTWMTDANERMANTIKAMVVRNEARDAAARNLLVNVRLRHPGEQLVDPFMIALDEAMAIKEKVSLMGSAMGLIDEAGVPQ